MTTFFTSNPGMSARIAHHVDCPDFSEVRLLERRKNALNGERHQRTVSDTNAR